MCWYVSFFMLSTVQRKKIKYVRIHCMSVDTHLYIPMHVFMHFCLYLCVIVVVGVAVTVTQP